MGSPMTTHTRTSATDVSGLPMLLVNDAAYTRTHGAWQGEDCKARGVRRRVEVWMYLQLHHGLYDDS